MGRISNAAAICAMALALAACGGGDTDADASGSGAAPPPASVLTSIAITPSATIVGVGLATTVAAEARDQNGAVMPVVAFTWATSKSSVGSVAAGVATGIAIGTTDITASSGGVTSGPARLTVVAVRKGSVVIDRTWLFLTATGEATRLTAQPFDAAGMAASGPVIWTSSAPDKVGVDAGGQVVALGIGSAQIVAEANGVRSPPTLVVVATPHAGALLLRDEQVVSVGPPLLAAGESAGVGTRYEVTLRGVAAPLPGTVVLATQTAPIHGKAVATRQEAGGTVVTLAVAPLYELLDAYDIRFRIALADFPGDTAAAPKPAAGKSPVWAAGSNAQVAAAAGPRKLEPFKPFDCDSKLEGKLASKTLQLTLDNKLFIVSEDSPGHSKRALEGSADIVGSAGVKLDVGFEAKGSCFAQAQIKLPVFGSFSALVMPGISFGFGVELDGKVKLVQGELGVDGTVGIAGSMGYECGGATPDCRALKELGPTVSLKTKSRIPSDRDPQAIISAHFYLFARLDAVVLLGATNLELVEAKIGPKQSFNMAFEKDQAARRDYASSYDLKLEGSIEPGSSLKKAIAMLIQSNTANLTFEVSYNKPLSESPKGTLTIDKTRVRPADKVDFVVDLDPKTVFYFLLGYNVTGVELWRKREDEADFKFWKFMEPTASQGTNFRYRWTPEEADAGKYEFASFVSTLANLPVPKLESQADSIKPLEVQCFSGGTPRPKGPPQLQGPAQCVDSYVGTSTYVVDTPGAPGNSITGSATITWVPDPSQSNANVTTYKATGRLEVAWNSTNGCTYSLSPKSFDIVDAPMLGSAGGLSLFKYPEPTPATYSFGGIQTIDTTLTTTCPGQPPGVTELRGLMVGYGVGSGPYTGQATLAGSTRDAAGSSTWNFSRP